MRALWERGKSWIFPVSAVCLVLGALLGLQVHTQQQRGTTEVSRRSSALVGMLTNSQAQLELQAKEIERLRALVGKLEHKAMSEKGVTQRIYQELQNSRMAAGLLPVRGPGVELELKDSTMRKGESDLGAQDIYVIHDYDLIRVANELWAAGAEAVTLNGQRLVTGTAIRCSGPLIQVKNTTIPSPFIFHVIGNRENLMSALNMRGGALDELRWAKFQVRLTPQDSLVLPAIPIAPKYTYARPVLEETP